MTASERARALGPGSQEVRPPLSQPHCARHRWFLMVVSERARALCNAHRGCFSPAPGTSGMSQVVPDGRLRARACFYGQARKMSGFPCLSHIELATGGSLWSSPCARVLLANAPACPLGSVLRAPLMFCVLILFAGTVAAPVRARTEGGSTFLWFFSCLFSLLSCWEGRSSRRQRTLHLTGFCT